MIYQSGKFLRSLKTLKNHQKWQKLKEIFHNLCWTQLLVGFQEPNITQIGTWQITKTRKKGNHEFPAHPPIRYQGCNLSIDTCIFPHNTHYPIFPEWTNLHSSLICKQTIFPDNEIISVSKQMWHHHLSNIIRSKKEAIFQMS